MAKIAVNTMAVFLVIMPVSNAFLRIRSADWICSNRISASVTESISMELLE